MEQLLYAAAWLARWSDDVTDALSSVVSTFEERYGYEPGANEVRAAGRKDPATRDAGRELQGFEDLLAFYEVIEEVVLPDVGNGFFLHSAEDVLRRLAEEGPVYVAGAGDAHGIVIASNGGGILYVADRGGAIHRSRIASLDDADLDKVADSLPQFLDHVRRSVIRFVETDEPGDL
ncbi:hypothetical protein OHT61_32425 (plasmid) [Streptomyces sp. NBC_00178]|uniref:hypothetical protein n=1 Tax=Streptomyces sp. NBC_00178 TaxID=2975672 RepID=UPI002E2DF509|nr:hypothetical protein [Streptomyces sp. NBC_00178]